MPLLQIRTRKSFRSLQIFNLLIQQSENLFIFQLKMHSTNMKDYSISPLKLDKHDIYREMHPYRENPTESCRCRVSAYRVGIRAAIETTTKVNLV